MWTQEVEFNEKGGFRDAFWVATSHEAEPDRTLTLGTLFPQAAPTSRRPRQRKPDGDPPHFSGCKSALLNL